MPFRHEISPLKQQLVETLEALLEKFFWYDSELIVFGLSPTETTGLI